MKSLLRRTALRRFALGGLSALLILWACTDATDLSSPGHGRGIRVRFTPQYTLLGGSYVGEPINRIRLTARNQATDVVLASDTFDVSPDSDNWNLDFSVTLPDGNPVDVLVTVELINVTNGVESVQWSGVTAPINLTPGSNAPPPSTPVQLVQGPVQNLTVTAVAISPSSGDFDEGGTLQLSAAITGGAPGAIAFWSSLDTDVATVDQTGLVSGVRNGAARIVAVAGPRSDTVTLNVRQRISAISISPDTARVFSFGDDVTFTARVLDPRGAEISGAAVSWEVANSTVAEHVGNGRFRSRGNGTTQISAVSASAPAIRGNGVIVVNQRAHAIEITPGSATLTAIGTTQVFGAAVRDARGNSVAAGITWRSSNNGVATISTAGVATAVATGTTQISAIVNAGQPDSLIANATLQVTQSIATVEIAPAARSFTAVGDTARFVAIAVDANNTPINDVDFVWTTSNANVATVVNGLVTARGDGSATITATAGERSASATVDVDVPRQPTRVVIGEASPRINALGFTRQVSAVVYDQHNVVMEVPVTWSSLDQGVATVSSTGLVTAVQNGQARIVASVNPADTVIVEISQIVKTVTVTPGNAALNVGDSISLAAVAKDSNNVVVANATVNWSSSAAAATVDNTGKVKAISAGPATITATAGGVNGTASIAVSIPVQADLVVDSVRITPPDTVIEGTALVIVGTVRNAGTGPSGNAFGRARVLNAATGAVIVSSSFPIPTLAAGVNAQGHIPVVVDTLISWPDSVKAEITLDTTNVVAETNEANNVFVTPAFPVRFRVASLAVTPAAISLAAIGDTALIVATPRDRYTRPLDRAVAYTSRNPSVATVSASGRVTALAIGQTWIDVVSELRRDSVSVTISQVIRSATLTPSDTTISLGSTAQYIASASDGRGNPIVGAVFVYASSDTSIATVLPATGLATARRAGTVTITATSDSISAAASLTIHAADLRVDSLRIVPDTLVEGSTVSVTGLLRNAGGSASLAAGARARIVDAATGAVLVNASFALPALNAGDTASRAFVLAVDTMLPWPDSVKGVIQLDTPNVVVESDETNNEFATAARAVRLRVATLQLSPASMAFSALGDTASITAITRDRNNNLVTRLVTYISRNPAIASVTANGLVTALTTGSTWIDVVSELRRDSVAVMVHQAVRSMTLTPADTTISVGATAQYLANAADGRGHAIAAAPFVYASSDSTIATVSATGLAIALRSGTVTITATSDSISATASLTVRAADLRVDSLRIVPDTLVEGSTVSVTGFLRNAGGSASVAAGARARIVDAVTGAVLLNAPFALPALNAGDTASRTFVLPVDTMLAWPGSVKGVIQLDTANVVAESDETNNEFTTSAHVVRLRVTTLQLSPATIAFSALGDTASITATTRDRNGGELDRPVTFESRDTTVATVSSSGLVTGVRAGSTFISVVSESRRDSVAVTVAQVAHSVSVTPPADTVAVANTVQLTGRVADARANEILGTPINWTSSDTTVATVSATGRVTGVRPGSVTITATVGALSGTAAVLVTPGAAQRILIASDSVFNAVVDQVAGDSLSVLVTDTFGNAVDGAEVEWTTSGGVVTAAARPALDLSSNGGGMRVSAMPPLRTATANGRAKISWKFPIRRGEYTVTACIVGVAGACKEFTGTARPDRPSRANKNGSADDQTVVVNRVAPNALEITVIDQFDNPTPGATVQWALAAPGTGLLSASSTTTNADGVAAVSWTMPRQKGRYSVIFTVRDTAGTVVAVDTFKATAKPDKPSRHVRANDEQVVTVNQTAPNALQLTLTDSLDNAIEGATVNWALRGSPLGASLNADSSTTDANGQASVSWTNVGKVAGTVFVDYTVTHDDTTVSGSFRARARAAKAQKGNKRAGDEQQIVVTRIAPTALEVSVLDEFDNPTRGTVDWSVEGSGGTLSNSSTPVDSTGIAVVQWTMPRTKGRYSVIFTVRDTAGTAVATDTFRATAKPDKPSRHNRANDDQVVTVDQTAPNALQLTLTDSLDNAIEGATVNWSLRGSPLGASLSGPTSTTDANGQASVNWTNVGRVANTVFVDYSITHDDTTLTGSFRARARAAKARKGNKRAGDEQQIVVNRIAPTALEVSVLDEFDNPTRGSVDWTVQGSGGVLSTNSTPVDSTGIALVQWTMPRTKGRYAVIFTVRDTAGVAVATDTFRATAKPDKPSRHNRANDDQIVTVNQTAPNALQLTLTDSLDNAVEGATVNWSLRGSPLGASLSGPTSTTDANGQASVNWTNVGRVANTVFVDYSVTHDDTTLTGSFRARARAAKARKGNKRAGDEQQIVVNRIAPTALEVSVLDEFDNPTRGSVDWTVQGSGGALSTNSTPVDSTGIAVVQWTMPRTKGRYSVIFTVRDTAGTAVATDTFRATAKPDKPSRHNRVNDNQTVTVNQTAPNALQLTLTDSLDNAIEGATVNWSLRGGDASSALSSASSITDANGQANVTWTNVGKTARDVFVDYSITHDDTTVTGSFRARARAAKAHKGNKNAGDEQQVIVNRIASNALEVTVLDEFDNPTRGSVDWSVVGSGGTLSANASPVDTTTGKATVQWTMPTIKGRYSVIFTVRDTAGSSVASDTFKATAKPDKPHADSSARKNPGRSKHGATVALALTDTVQVEFKDQYGNTVENVPLSWIKVGGDSSEVGVVETATDSTGVASGGWILGKKAGSHGLKILAGIGDDTASIVLINTTKPGPVRKLRFSPSPRIDAFEDSSSVLTAAPADEFDNDVDSTTTWVSSKPTKLSVRNNGLLRSHQENDSIYVYGTSGGYTDSVLVVVRQRIRFLELNADTLTALQINKRLRRTQKDRNQIAIDSAFHEALVWSSSNPAVATVDVNTGVVTSITNGFSTITARAVSDSAILANVVVEVRQEAGGGITFHGGVLPPLNVMGDPPTSVVVGDTAPPVYAHALDSNNRPVSRWTWSFAPVTQGASVAFAGSQNQQRDSVINVIGTGVGTVYLIATDARGARSDTLLFNVVNIPTRPQVPSIGTTQPEDSVRVTEPAAMDKPRKSKPPGTQ